MPAQAALCLQDMPCSAQALPDFLGLTLDAPADLELACCAFCGLVQSQTAPVPYYREVIRATAFSREMGQFRREQLARFVARHVLQGRKVLEVGSGRGEYLQLLQDSGVQAFGTEFGVTSVLACHAQGLQVEQVFPEARDLNLMHGPFDAWVCFNFLEHWPNPRATLKAVYANLSENAVGLVEVPNFDMILSKHLITEFISDHLLYFTSHTLRTMLEVSGFEVLEISPIWHDYILSAQVRKRPSFFGDPFSLVLRHMKEAILQFVTRHGQNGVAVWGAGHQALAALSLLRLRNHIRYVVDSAPFKQGRYTPATHIPIYAPEQLRMDPVGAVIVMAAGYSDEVVRLIRDGYGNTMQLAILRESELEVLQ